MRKRIISAFFPFFSMQKEVKISAVHFSISDFVYQWAAVNAGTLESQVGDRDYN